MRIILKLVFLTLILNGCTTTHIKNQDLDFIYKTIVENHPGMCNDLDQQFKENLECAYHEAQRTLQKAPDLEQQKQIITTFAKSFDDNHLWVRWKNAHKKSPDLNKNLHKFQITHLNKHAAWITLPSFDLTSDQEKEFNKILKKIPSLKHKKAIVFDLRGNGGGNSKYGNHIVEHLFGKKYFEQRGQIICKNQFIDWRASKDNLMYLQPTEAQTKSPWLKEVAHGIQESLAHNKPYYREDTCTDSATQNGPQLSHDVTAKIIVVINSGNASAALDFIDDLTMMEHKITLIGQKTGTDRLYMDVRWVALPSGQGNFVFPMKVYRNRPRGDKVPYVPDIEYDTTNTKDLQQFILKTFG